MTVEVFDYRLYRDTEVNELKAILQKKHLEWSADWVKGVDTKSHLDIATDLPLKQENWLVGGDIALSLTSYPWAFVSKLCFGYEVTQDQCDAPLCKDILDKILQSYLDTLFQLKSIPAEEQNVLPKKFRQVGCLFLSFYVADVFLNVVLNSVKVMQLLNKPTISYDSLLPFSISQLSRDEKVSVCVHSHSTSLTVGELSNINIGDVIKLDHEINQFFELRSIANENIAEATLGCVSDKLSVRIYSNEQNNNKLEK